MEKETHRICQQMKQAFEGNAWHGPSLTEVLDGVDEATACDKPIDGAHSIWEIVLHLMGTQKVMLRRLAGDATDLTPDEDWPPVPAPTAENWLATVNRLEAQDQELRAAVQAFPIDRLDKPLVPGGSSAYNNFHGYVQHGLYHAAQIALLKRAAADG